MTKEDNLFNEIVEFVFSVRWRYKQVLTRETKLLEDLRIDGDDAVDFFVEFEKKFKIDVSDFNLGDYFNPEGFDPVGVSRLFRLLTGKSNMPYSQKTMSITLGHLEKAIKAGRLDNEIINR